MKHKIFSLVSLLAIAILFTACASQVQAVEIPATPSFVVQSDPTEGQASLMINLQNAGAQVELGDSIEQPFFTMQGKILKVNGADVQVFEYASAEAMEADVALISADGGSVGTSMISWKANPHFFKSDSMIVLYVGDDDSILTALQSVLGEQFAGR